MEFGAKHFDFNDSGYCVIIGEIGVNHNGDEATLFKMIDEGIAAGLDIIKLQRFNSALEISSHAALANYQAENGVQEANQLEMAQALELSDELLIKAFDYCREKGAGFLCTAFEHESVDFLADTLGVKTVKVPSPEISNKPLLEYMAQKFEAMIVSTGASTMDEVEQALSWIKAINPDVDLALMHCTSQYPAPIEQINLKAMDTMRAAFGIPVGYSDHTEGIIADIVCAGRGAAMIEKHYTLDKNMKGPDHKASVDIAELTVMIDSVRQASASLGDGVKQPVMAESETRPKIRKSLYVHADKLAAGTVITADMLQKHIVGIKRPYNPQACTPEDFGKIVGKSLKVEKSHDEPLYMKDFG